YYLASVPATIGGALAMNAGKRRIDKKSIYDFVISVKYIDENNEIKVLKVEDMDIEFRRTVFTGCQEKFILGGLFKFPSKEFYEENPIKERVIWAKKYQDNVAPNCGSVFNKSNYYIMRLLRGFKIGKAQYSSKTQNWIKNEGANPFP